jgi:hypothetical protein
MSDALIKNLLTIAQTVAPLVPFGGTAVAIATAAVGAIDAAKASGLFGGADASALLEARDALEQRVNEHATRTADSLG